jgi:RNA polymerase primary sigma factor
MESYLKEISKIKLLTIQEEVELCKRIQKGDKLAKDLLIKHNLRYVLEVAKKYQNKGLPLEELIAEGNYGICKAADRFKPDRGVKFISYAVWWIRQSILQALSDNTRTVRIPVNQIHNVQKARKSLEKREQEQGFKIENNEDVDIDAEVDSMYSSSPISLNSDNANNQPMIDIVPNENADFPDSHTEEESLRIDIDDALSILTDKEKEILKYYHGINEHRSLTLEEIGNIIGLTRERIRQIKKKSLSKISKNTKTKNLLTKYM